MSVSRAIGSVGALVAVGIGAWLALGSATSPSVDLAAGLSVGVFGALLTAMTILVAVTLDGLGGWPPSRVVLERAGVTLWFLFAAAAVLVALVAALLGSTRLGALALVLSVGELIAGVWAMRQLSLLGVGGGAASLRASILRRGLGAGGRHDAELLDEYRKVAQAAMDASSVGELQARVVELDAATANPTSQSLEAAYSLGHQAFAAVVHRCLDGRLASTDVHRPIRGMASVLIRLSSQIVDQNHDERRAAVLLGSTARLCGWLRTASSARPQLGPEERTALLEVTSWVRKEIVSAIDPDPPERYIEPGSPWARGLNDPVAALEFIELFADYDPVHLGSALYALHEILTGEKFFGDYWFEADILPSIASRLDAGSPASRALESRGGLGIWSLRMGAGTLRDRRPIAASGSYSAAMRKQARSDARLFAAYREPDQLHRPAAALASVLSCRDPRETLAGDLVRPGPDLTAVSRDPAAVALAAGLRYVPLDGDGDRSVLREFWELLPGPLLAAASELASGALGCGHDRADSRGETIDRLTDQLSLGLR